ncbi:MAG: hypothetical protein GWP05_07815 [Anaerolineaceae bacterium]|nr:hypothetical protein [Anaerolineaceae bacterium]
MISTFPRKPLMIGLIVVLSSCLSGCGYKSSSRPGPVADSPVVRVLRSQTDALLQAIGSGNIKKVRQHYAPDAEVDLDRELRFYLGDSIRNVNLYQWSAKAIAVELSDDGLAAKTGVEVMLQDSRNQLRRKGIIFSWARTDDRDMSFHLVPQTTAPH